MRVAVFGAGYAGLSVARRLERRLPADTDLVVVDDSGTHLVQHELHRTIRRPSIADVIEIPLDDLLDRATVRRERVTAVDPEAGVARLRDGRLQYDYAAVCLGAETEFYGLSGVAEHGLPLKRLDDAVRIRERAFELVDDGGTAVVGGGGLSGIQIAGELAALAREEGAADRLDVVLVEREPALAPGFPPAFRDAVGAALAERGVDVRTGVRVTGATADRVETADGPVPADLFVWAGGIRGPDATDGSRPTVRADLRLSGSTFALGDAARVIDADGEPVPASAAAAVREARVAAANVARLVEHDPADGLAPSLDRYRFDVPGWLVSVGDGAVAQLGPEVLTGRAAIAAKTTVGAGYLASAGTVTGAVELVEEELGLDGGR